MTAVSIDIPRGIIQALFKYAEQDETVYGCIIHDGEHLEAQCMFNIRQLNDMFVAAQPRNLYAFFQVGGQINFESLAFPAECAAKYVFFVDVSDKGVYELKIGDIASKNWLQTAIND